MLVHKHVIIRAKIDYPTNDIEYFSNWMKDLVKKIDMNLLMGPFTVYSDMIGNRGITSVAVIETSHISAHVWDEESPAIIELDVFSCKDFEVDDVIQHLKIFGLRSINFRFFDRTNSINEEKLHIVYETTNLINGKTYVGVHSGFETGDDYLGSGTALKNAIKKYGKENFNKKILKVFSDKNKAYEYESKIVTAEYVNDPTTYNLKVGGTESYVLTENTKQKIKEKANKRPNRSWITNEIENLLMNESDADKFLSKNPSWKKGRTICQEHFDSMNKSKKGMQSHRKGKNIEKDQIEKIRETMKNKFSNGYTIHNKGKKLIEIDGKKTWI